MLAPQKISVKCPHCSKQLSVSMTSGVTPNMTVTCPVCKQKFPFSVNRVAAAPAPRSSNDTSLPMDVDSSRGGYAPQPAYSADPNATQYGSMAGVGGVVRGNDNSGEKTVLDLENINNKSSCGKLIFLADGISDAELKEGINIIGREANSSAATIRLPRNYDRISREHLIINVKRVGGSCQHTVQLYKREVNPTMHNAKPMVAGDVLLLKDGDTITLPGLEVRFKI